MTSGLFVIAAMCAGFGGFCFYAHKHSDRTGVVFKGGAAHIPVKRSESPEEFERTRTSMIQSAYVLWACGGAMFLFALYVS